MEAYFGKKYKLKSSENFDEYLKIIGVGLVARKVAATATMTSVLLRNDDGTYTFKMISIFTMESKFKLGEEYVEERPDGIKIKCVMTIEGNKLIQIQVAENGRKCTIVREFTPEALIMTVTAENWNDKCVLVFEATD